MSPKSPLFTTRSLSLRSKTLVAAMERVVTCNVPKPGSIQTSPVPPAVEPIRRLVTFSVPPARSADPNPKPAGGGAVVANA
jgi:hypothetical protein